MPNGQPRRLRPPRAPRPRGPRLATLAALLALAGCTARLAGESGRPRSEVAIINVGSTVVRQIDEQRRRGGALDVSAFEVAPGPHRLVLVFELPARSLGLKSLPAQPGVGVCQLTFEAQARRQYYLVARPLGDFNSPRWSGAWEAWIRDPAIADEDDVIARCQGQEPAATPTPLIAGAAPGTEPAAPAGAAGAVGAAPVPVPTAKPLALPAARPLRVGAWHLPALVEASPADTTDAAAAIGASFDVLTIAPAVPPAALLGALGSAWAAHATPTETTFYRRDLVRPCAEPPAAGICLEAIDGARGATPLLLRLPGAGAPR